MSEAPIIPGLLDPRVRPVAPASLEGWKRIHPTLSTREREVYYLVADYLRETKRQDVTGGELASWAQQSILSVRPRLSGLETKGWILRTPLPRASRAPGEARAHAYRLAVPVDALNRSLP